MVCPDLVDARVQVERRGRVALPDLADDRLGDAPLPEPAGIPFEPAVALAGVVAEQRRVVAVHVDGRARPPGEPWCEPRVVHVPVSDEYVLDVLDVRVCRTDPVTEGVPPIERSGVDHDAAVREEVGAVVALRTSGSEPDAVDVHSRPSDRKPNADQRSITASRTSSGYDSSNVTRGAMYSSSQRGSHAALM